MTRRKRLPEGIRKYIRQEKAHLRREILNVAEQKKKIYQIYQKLGLERNKLASS